ncbi:class I SAM-dependent methyltransferase [Streptomyces sp. NBC_01233]|uniref:class I SAM-dependent methyltransferase n=1 Tax=Streptomyces sp. NBC_01233 TaxID=2903787 RepID=UPI002E114F13|nr:class I SAM-dependent methyltransferase [Streptomyces sp. NBC_01233]
MTDRTASITAYWDAAAAAFDEEPDHGLRADDTRAAWARLLQSVMPDRPVGVLDIDCGTGSVSLLLAEAGHRPTGVDLAPRMIERARTKFEAAGLAGRFLVGDAMAPPTGDERFDVVLSRHLVWTLPDPEAALRDWVTRLQPGGRLVLVEGRWSEAGQQEAPYMAGAESLPWNGGLSAEALAAAVRPLAARVRVEPLSDTPALWGGPVDDERYVLVAAM